MFLGDGQAATLRDVLLGLAVPSGNDAAVCIALNFAPSVDEFAGLMNRAVSGMGLRHTRFVEPSGVDERNVTTAAEFAQFCRVYVELHPEALVNFHAVATFEYPKPDNMLPGFKYYGANVFSNHNPLLGSYPGVDGLKTGYIDEAGYNIALTARRGPTRFIAVLLGVPAELGRLEGPRVRAEDGRAILDWAFANYYTLHVKPPEPKEFPVYKSKQKKVYLTPDHSVVSTLPVGRGENLSWRYEVRDPIVAPLALGDELGEAVLVDDEGEIARAALLAPEDIPAGSLPRRAFDTVRLWFKGILSPPPQEAQ
jgi:D-alanyl-D-alanine carboxypeptidase (penicillin-binding protein 5/6)